MKLSEPTYSNIKRSVIIAAAGSGMRMGSHIPKQFVNIGGKSILEHTCQRLYHFDSELQFYIVVANLWMGLAVKVVKAFQFAENVRLVSGGNTRYQSVKNALLTLPACDWVMVHDGVRPFVSNKLLTRLYETALEGTAVIPVINATDSLRLLTDQGSHALNREKIRMVQTPQIFPYEKLFAAYAQTDDNAATDDASIYEQAGFELKLIAGETQNLKITQPDDMILARYKILKQNRPDCNQD